MNITGIRKAIIAYNQAEQSTMLHARFYLNIEKYEVWVDLFGDRNGYTKYSDNNIVEIFPERKLEYSEKLTMAALNKFCIEEINEHGGKIEEFITLVEYAKINSIDSVIVRHKAQRGGFSTAKKIGRDWFIDKNEKYIDNRVKSGKYKDWRNKDEKNSSNDLI